MVKDTHQRLCKVKCVKYFWLEVVHPCYVWRGLARIAMWETSMHGSWLETTRFCVLCFFFCTIIFSMFAENSFQDPFWYVFIWFRMVWWIDDQSTFFTWWHCCMFICFSLIIFILSSLMLGACGCFGYTGTIFTYFLEMNYSSECLHTVSLVNHLIYQLWLMMVLISICAYMMVSSKIRCQNNYSLCLY